MTAKSPADTISLPAAALKEQDFVIGPFGAATGVGDAGADGAGDGIRDAVGVGVGVGVEVGVRDAVGEGVVEGMAGSLCPSSVLGRAQSG
ncbi:MAG: hypothetical protein AAGJ35_02600 [Myxococcota bacterium]